MIVYDKSKCLDWMAQWLGRKTGFENYCAAIGYERNGKLVSVVAYSNYTGHDVEMGRKTGFENYCAAIGYERNGKLVSVVAYSNYTGHDVEMGLLHARYAPMEYVKAVFAYPFKQLECSRVTAEIASKNAKMLHMIEKLGFKREGVKRSAIPGDDYIVFGMTRAECRYI